MNDDKELPQSDFKAFTRELTILINMYSMENGSNTPDFILADYLTQCLVNFNNATGLRTDWYTHDC